MGPCHGVRNREREKKVTAEEKDKEKEHQESGAMICSVCPNANAFAKALNTSFATLGDEGKHKK